MRKLKKEKIVSFMLAFVMAVTPVTVSVKAEETVISNAEKYEDILGMYKTIDETIELLIDRAKHNDFIERTYFIKTTTPKIIHGQTNTTRSWWENVVTSRVSYAGSVNIFDNYKCQSREYETFKVGDYYYHTLRINMGGEATTVEEKTAFEEKAEYVENMLGLFNDEMCDYEKASIIFNYIDTNIRYNIPSLYNGKSRTQWYREIGYDNFMEFLDTGTMEIKKLYGGQTAYEALMYDEAVCGGQSRLYEALLNDFDIKNLHIEGGNHAWSLVKLSDEWVYSDITNGAFQGINLEGYTISNNSKEAIKYFNCNINENGFPVENYGNYELPELIFSINEYIAPTCSTNGSYEIDCDYCKKHHSITISEAHYYSYNITKEATCTEDGYGTAVCRLCGDTKSYTIPAKGHRWMFSQRDAGCENTGYEEVCCEDCGKEYWKWIEPARGHKWSDWSAGSQSTKCYRTCENDNCHEKEYRLKDEYAPTSEEKEKKDRGLGIKAYAEDNTDASDNGLKIWKYYDSETDSWNELTDWCEVYSESINGYALWNPDTCTFVSKDEYVTKKDRGYGVLGYFDLESRQWKTYIPWADDWQVHPKDGSYNRRVYPTDCDENSEKYEYYIEGHGWQNVYFYWDYATHSVIKEGYFKEENPLISGNNESGKEDGTENPTTSGNNNNGTGKNDSSNNNVTSNNITSLKNDNNKKISETIITKPAKTAGVNVTSKKKSLKITWKKVKGVKKYRVQLCTSKKFKKGVITRNVSKNMLTIKKLKTKKKYYVRVCAVKTSGKKTVYGKWSKVANKKTK